MFEQAEEAPVAEDDRDGLAERRRAVAPGQKLILVATSVVAALLILFGIASKNNYFGVFGAHMTAKAEPPTEAHPVTAPEVQVPLALGEPAVAPAAYVECPGGLRLPIGLDCPDPQRQPPADSAAGPNQELSEAHRIRERRLKSSITLASDPGGPVARAGGPRAAATNAGWPGASTPQGGVNALAGALSATLTPGTSATINRNPSMTLAKGTLPDCTLLTAILTDQPGFLKCLLSAPVMSMDGKVVLMEAGTTMEGEYTQGMQAGQRTIFTLWSRAVTPNFVSVQLNSPGTDALGRAGTSGDVDNRWIERFAGAVFFSLFEDAKQVYVARGNARAAHGPGEAGGTTFNIGTQGTFSQFGNTDNTSRSIVEEMLKQGSQLRPRLYKNQGEIIKIYVARDVDFSNVYELRPVVTSN